MKLFYLSSCITHGDKNFNYYIAAQAHIRLLRNGFSVVNPMATMTMPEAANVDWETWLRADERIIEACDGVIALPHGFSEGRAREVEYARKIGKPVYGIEDFPFLADLYEPQRPSLIEEMAQAIAHDLLAKVAA